MVSRFWDRSWLKDRLTVNNPNANEESSLQNGDTSKGMLVMCYKIANTTARCDWLQQQVHNLSKSKLH